MNESQMIATPAYSPARRRPFRIALRILLVLVVLAGLILAAGILWFRSVSQAALPQLDGTIKLSGLTAPVTVVRDSHGVPHIMAASLEDLFFAQGYVTAQDRLWQMDMTRRYAAGELSAVLGSSTLETDKHQRILGLRQVAQNAVAALSPTTRRYLEVYARGVNAYIADHQHSLPAEFRVLRYFPHAWTPEDSFLVGASMAEFLNHGYYAQELEREQILARLGPELTSDLYVNASYRDIPPSGGSTEIEGTPDENDVQPSPGEEQSARRPRRRKVSSAGTLPSAASVPGLDALFPGSNNWVVSGAHTTTGKPLLSNDMHLAHHIPNTWYEAHLKSGDYYDVAGVTLPGTPFVIVGHNLHIAWGFTNVGPDVEDVFIENFNERGEYQTPQGWRAPEHRVETIHGKNGRDVTLDVVVTRHGPIITPTLKNETRQIALKWAIYDPMAFTFPFFDVNSARNWQEFREAFRKFGGPGQNVVYADVDGHIGYQATGLVPIRASGDGSLPVSGADDAHEWTGYIPFDQMPSVFDPPSGILATANGRITPDGYPYSISTQWGSPYRTERINRVLRANKKFTSADMLALQTDVYSEFDKFMAERFVYAVDHSSKTSARAKAAADVMRNWDGRVTKDSAAATVNLYARRKLTALLLDAKLGPQNAKLYSWFMAPVWLETVVSRQPQRWLPPGYTNYGDLLVAAVEQAVKDKAAPRDLSSWKWGESFPVELSHPVFGRIPILRRWAGPGIQPQSGDSYTVKQVGRLFGPSERMTVDFSDLDASTLNLVNGQAGNIFSPYFNDHFAAWYDATTFALPYSQPSIDKSQAHRLTLTP
jgi:penicillin G amidase